MPAKRPITAEDLYDLKSVEDPQISPDGRHLAFVKVEVDRLDNKYKRRLWLIRLGDAASRPVQFTFGSGSDFAPRWRPDSRALAFVSTREGKPQIYLIGLEGGEARALTTLPNGAANPVWSLDSKRLAFLSSVNAEERAREDSGESEPSPASALEAKQKKEREEEKEKAKRDPRVITRLPYRAGTEYYDDRFSHIYVMDVKASGEDAGKPYRLTDGDLNFGSISWARDGSFIISTQSRQPEYDPWFYTSVVRINATGRRKPYRIISQPGHEYFGPQVSPDGKWIAATQVEDEGSFGQRSRLVILPVSGGPARVLTAELDRSIGEFRWASDSRSLLFLVNDLGNTHLYRAEVKTSQAALVIGGRRALLGFSTDRAGQVAFVAHTATRPTDVYLARANGKAEKRLTDFNAKLLSERVITPIEEVWHTAPDGRRIQGWLMKPVGFRAGRKYPLVLTMHGGPWVMWGPGMPNIWLEWQLHAARGYAVYFCNPRGSEGYG